MRLKLSHNFLVDLQEPFSNLPPHLSTLDLHSNLLHGRIPISPKIFCYVDYTQPTDPEDIGSYISFTIFFSFKDNISGIIPASILDFSNNALNWWNTFMFD